MRLEVIVEPLHLHPEHVGTFVRAFEHEWPAWYGPGGCASAIEDLRAFARSDAVLPVGVVALGADARACGVAALKARSLPQYAHRTPWAGAGYVLPEYRRQGVGGALLDGLRREARRMGYEVVYCATSTAVPLLERQGWQRLEQLLHEGRPITVFRSAA